MKFSLALFFTILSSLVLSCTKKTPEEISPEPPKPVETLQTATVLAEKAHLCLYGRDEKMHRISELKKSSTIDILYIDDNLESMEADDSVFLPVVYDSCDYWINGNYLALNSIPAVIIENATLYENSDLASNDGKFLKFGQTIALSLQEDHTTENALLIYFMDRQDGTIKTAWIKKDCASHREDDIVVMQVVESLKVTKRATPRNELFRKAAKYKPCAKVAAALDAQKVELVENSYQDVLNALPGARIKVNVHELLTVDQSKDPFK